MFLRSFSFDEVYSLGLAGEILNRVVSQPIVASMGKVIKATENHFQRNISEGAVQGFSNSVSQADQEGIQEPGGPDLQLDTIDGGGMEISQSQEPFNSIEGILDAPSLVVKSDDTFRGKKSWVEDISQVPIPFAAKVSFDQVTK